VAPAKHALKSGRHRDASTTQVVSYGSQKFLFFMSLESSQCLFSIRTTSGIGGGMIYHQRCFLFFSPLFSISSPRDSCWPFKIPGLSFYLLISTSFFILLIFNYCSWYYCKILICFQFYPLISIHDMLFFFFLI
jgi:hypothetical protein